jgi:hypothetical protein
MEKNEDGYIKNFLGWDVVDHTNGSSCSPVWFSGNYRCLIDGDKPGLEIKSVEFINTKTIVYWNDGTKTVAVARNEEFNDEKGLAMAIVKKFLGNYTKFDKAYKNAERKTVTKLTRKERKALQTNMETPRTMEEFLSFDLGAEESKG